MFGWLHSIFGKIAIGISSLLIATAGAISPAPKTTFAPLATSTSEVRTTETTTEAPKLIINGTSDVTTTKLSDYSSKALKNTASNSSPSATAPKDVISEAEWRDSLIITNANNVQNVKNFLSTIQGNLIDMSTRRSKIANRLTIINALDFGSSQPGLTLNKMLSLYGQEHQRDIDFIDKDTQYINTQISFLNTAKNQAENTGNNLVNDLNTPVPHSQDDIVASIKQNAQVVDDIYSVELNVLSGLKNYYGSVITEEDNYQSEWSLIQSYIDKMTTPLSQPPSTVYQPLPAPIQMPAIPQSTHCTITGDGGAGLEAYVNCTTY